MASQTPEEIKDCFDDLDFTKRLRRQIVDGISAKAITDRDPEMLRTTMQALDGIDKVAIGRLRLNEKDKENATAASEAEALSRYLVHLSSNNNTPREAPTTGNDTRDQKLPSEHRPDYDPTMRDTAPTGENTSDFKDRVEKKLPSR